MAPMSGTPADALCVSCLHPFIAHHGEAGPCKAAHTGRDGKPLAATVCPCSEFTPTGVTAAVAEPKPVRPARRRRPPAAQGDACCMKGCKTPATVVVEKNGKPYCRPHGLAEALRLPRCEIHPLPEQAAVLEEAWRAA